MSDLVYPCRYCGANCYTAKQEMQHIIAKNRWEQKKGIDIVHQLPEKPQPAPVSEPPQANPRKAFVELADFVWGAVRRNDMTTDEAAKMLYNVLHLRFDIEGKNHGKTNG